MKAIVIPDYNTNVIRAMKSLHVMEIATPQPENDQVLIKVAAAPCNPSDIAFMRGGYNIRKPVPAIMGFECTGTVIKTGNDPMARELLGKRVSCFANENDDGTWAEFFMTSYRNCLLLSDKLNDDQAAAFCINPFTAFALFNLAIEKKTGAIIQNGAAGQVGTFIRTLAKRSQIPVINIVRKDEQVQMLKDTGEEHVLSLNDNGFENHLEKLAYEYRARIAFDAVSGDLSGIILNAMPAGSDLVIYGALSGKTAGMINPLDIIFKAKTVLGFNLNDWKSEVGEAFYQKASEELQELFINDIFLTRIQRTYSLEEVQQAIAQYIRNMSAGKILFRP